MCYSKNMSDTETKDDLEEHLAPAGAPSSDAAYAAHKKAKVKKGLEEAQNRSRLIPAHEVWDKLGLER